MDSTSICTGNVASRYAVGITVRAKLIRYAPIVDGTRINPTVVFDGYPLIRSAGTTQPGSPVLPSNLRVILGATTINVLTCSTRDVQVNMGRVARSDFNGVNGPLRSFAINLNCPANMNRVTVRVDPNTAEMGNQGIVALDAQSSAAGVGVQLLTGSGAAFPLRTAVPVSQYNPAQSGSFDIPVQVRYVQVGGAISAGTANTTMMFTLTYE
ncbi:type 1 fimbrial protein [Achromobacter xylosoxidans]|uniref:fimbrial protein n=1 Tax=Alcaligenes xylosoxydans xylosoxydans TaxID=85698 RepID=UPI001904450C|nr:fimbrial protein [Achromobacter xylosoxidans]MBK1979382.1 type 1 fimbrial protein [Achromobacter xylosoxidans]